MPKHQKAAFLDLLGGAFPFFPGILTPKESGRLSERTMVETNRQSASRTFGLPGAMKVFVSTRQTPHRGAPPQVRAGRRRGRLRRPRGDGRAVGAAAGAAHGLCGAQLGAGAKGPGQWGGGGGSVFRGCFEGASRRKSQILAFVFRVCGC